ncbi:hypothetical protein CDAR_538531 [Caerostris darwini]|uniref:Uncharacterized protein n=1 Tax=Caerostris darwini TaxID=1538125 RepID=A0AAV4UCU6_9ARAC|nr:hypothetical protein CDAR_538531 [Caerostris darwini]
MEFHDDEVNDSISMARFKNQSETKSKNDKTLDGNDSVASNNPGFEGNSAISEKVLSSDANQSQHLGDIRHHRKICLNEDGSITIHASFIPKVTDCGGAENNKLPDESGAVIKVLRRSDANEYSSILRRTNVKLETANFLIEGLIADLEEMSKLQISNDDEVH